MIYSYGKRKRCVGNVASERHGRTTNRESYCLYLLKMKNSFYEMLCDTATKYPDKIGIVDNWNREYTYQKFLEMVNQLAAYMKHILKVEKGNHIGLLLNNGIEFATAIYAVCKLGAVAVPLPTKYREPEIQSLVKKQI